LGVGNYCYVAVCSAALGASAPTEGGEGHIVAAVHLQLVNRVLGKILTIAAIVRNGINSVKNFWIGS